MSITLPLYRSYCLLCVIYGGFPSTGVFTSADDAVDSSPIRDLLRVIRENMRAVRFRPVFHDHLRVHIGAALGLAAGPGHCTIDLQPTLFHDFLRVPNRAVVLSAII